MKLALFLSALTLAACASTPCPDCTIFDPQTLGSVVGQPLYDARYDRDGDGSISTLDYQLYLRDCSRR